MPIYEYKCTNCDNHIEKLQKVADAELTFCEKCNTDSLKKIISQSGFQLKGSGWYATDFKDNNKKSETKNPPPCASSGSCPHQ